MSWVRHRLQEGQLALMLLTRLPTGNLGLNVPKLASAVWFFPIVGIPIGLLVGLTYIATYNFGILPIWLQLWHFL